jgi:hypothetical protein
LRKCFGLDYIPNECSRYLSRRPLVHFTYLFNYYLRLFHFRKPWKEAKLITLPKPSKVPKFAQNLLLVSLLSTIGKLFEKVILKMVRRHIEDEGLLNASQFGFRARHSVTHQCMRLTDHVTLNFSNNIYCWCIFGY